MEGLTEEVTFGQGPELGKGSSSEQARAHLGEQHSDGGNSQCKDSEVGLCLPGLLSSREAFGVRQERTLELRVGEATVRLCPPVLFLLLVASTAVSSQIYKRTPLGLASPPPPLRRVLSAMTSSFRQQTPESAGLTVSAPAL